MVVDLCKTKMFDYDLIIIGGGSAGLSLASVSARAGVKVALIDKEHLGGDCLHYGCVPSKTLIHAARVAHLARTGSEVGIHTSNIEVDFPVVMQRVHNVIKKIQHHADSPERFRAMGCDVFTETEASFVNEHTVDIGTGTITGKTIAICCGTRPNIPDIDGLQTVEYLTNETLFSLREQPRHLAIIGAGPIGAEMAQAFKRLGSEVTLLNRNECVLDREDDDIRDHMCTVFKNENINLEVGVELQKIEQNTHCKKIRFIRNGVQHSIECDQLLLAVGRRSNADTVKVENAGIDLTNHGYVQTNDYLQTSQPHIYAAGDVSGHLQFTHAAGYEAGVVFRNALLMPHPFKTKIHTDLIPWTTFTDPEVASCGKNEQAAEKENLDYTVHRFEHKHVDRALAEHEGNGFTKIIVGKKDRILGVQIVGHNAGELIHEWIVARNHNIKLNSIASMVHVYPTLSGGNQQIAGDYLGKKFFTPKTRKWVRRIFGYRNTKIDSQ